MNYHLLTLCAAISLHVMYFNNPPNTLRQIISSFCTSKERHRDILFKITQLEKGGDGIQTRTLSNFPVASLETVLKLSYIIAAQCPSKEIPVHLFLFQSNNSHYMNWQFKKRIAFIHFFIGSRVETWSYPCSRFNWNRRRNQDNGSYSCPCILV